MANQENNTDINLLRTEFDALKTKADVLEKLNKSLTIKNEYLLKENVLLKDENSALSSEINKLEGISEQNATLDLKVVELQKKLHESEQRQLHIVLQEKYKLKRGMARDYLISRLSKLTPSIRGKRLKQRIFDMFEMALLNGEAQYTEILAHNKISKPTLSRDLHKLKKSGFIITKRGKKGNRILLTPAGEQMKKEFDRIVNG
jgi:predicted transcriptional regulator